MGGGQGKAVLRNKKARAVVDFSRKLFNVSLWFGVTGFVVMGKSCLISVTVGRYAFVIFE